MSLPAPRQSVSPGCLPRHRHTVGYVAVVLAGAYEEAGDAGRRQLGACISAFSTSAPAASRGGAATSISGDPDAVTLGVGALDFSPADLERYRKAFAYDAWGADLAATITRLGARQHDADLKRVPAPYPAGHPRAELLKRKGLTVWRDLDDPGLVASPDLVDAVAAQFEALDAVNVWLTDVLEP